MSDEATDEMWMPGHSMSFEVERTPAVKVAEPDHTISADALTTLVAEIGTFILSRLSRAMDRGHAPQRVEVRVSVRLDGDPAE
jgi:hypothetical protein